MIQYMPSKQQREYLNERGLYRYSEGSFKKAIYSSKKLSDIMC